MLLPMRFQESQDFTSQTSTNAELRRHIGRIWLRNSGLRREAAGLSASHPALFPLPRLFSCPSCFLPFTTNLLLGLSTDRNDLLHVHPVSCPGSQSVSWPTDPIQRICRVQAAFWMAIEMHVSKTISFLSLLGMFFLRVAICLGLVERLA